MFCGKCGKELPNESKFCPYCGAVIGAGQEGGGPVFAVPDAPAAPAGGGKRRGKGLLIGAGAAVVLVVALVVAAAAGLFSSPKGAVEAALAKSVAAYADAKGKLDLPDLTGAARERSVSQRVRVELNGISGELTGYDLSSLQGLGLRADSDWDQAGRKLDGEVAAFWGDSEILSFQLLVDDDRLTLSSPQFTGGAAYGLNTETLGVDLSRLGVEDDEVDVRRIGFNLFDLMEQVVPSEERTKEAEQRMKDAAKGLLDAAKVAKEGKESVQVNGTAVDAVVYRVTIPEEALRDYVDALAEAMELSDGVSMVRSVLESMGLPEDAIDEVMDEVAGADLSGEMADGLRQAVEAVGDLELEVCVSDGYVSALRYAGTVNDAQVELGLYLGGSGEYVDDLSLALSVDGEELLVESSGDHGGKDGVFTDETVVRLRSGGSDAVRFTSGLRYEPKATDGNFQWEIGVDGAGSVVMDGQLTTGKDSLELALDGLSLRVAGTELVSLTLDCYVGPCRGMEVSHDDPKLLEDMSEDDLLDLMDDVEDNGEAWLYDMVGLLSERLPMELFWPLLSLLL